MNLKLCEIKEKFGVSVLSLVKGLNVIFLANLSFFFCKYYKI